MPFELKKWTPVTISHVNLRGEKHGDTRSPAIDIKCKLTAENALLDLLDPRLRRRLCYSRAAEAGQADVAGVTESLPDVMFPRLKQPLTWGEDLTGATAVFDYGAGGDSNIELTGCKVKSIEFEVLQGGSCNLVWSIQCNDYAEGVIDKLSHSLDQQLPLLLLPPGVVAEEGGYAASAKDGDDDMPHAGSPPPGLFDDNGPPMSSVFIEPGDPASDEPPTLDLGAEDERQDGDEQPGGQGMQLE